MNGFGVCKGKAINVRLLESWTGEGMSTFIDGDQQHEVPYDSGGFSSRPVALHQPVVPSAVRPIRSHNFFGNWKCSASFILIPGQAGTEPQSQDFSEPIFFPL